MNKKIALLLAVASFVIIGFARVVVWPDEMPHGGAVPAPVAASGDYAVLWARVDSLERKGLPKSALEVVQTIYQQAKAEQNEPQTIKTVIFLMKYNLALSDTAIVTNLALLQAEIDGAKAPVKQILNSLKGQLYCDYYVRNQWQFRLRSEIVVPNAEDIRTWDIKKILHAAENAFDQSLSNAEPSDWEMLPLANFDAVLDTQPKSKRYRPTLYDLLAQRALGFYRRADFDVDPSPKPFRMPSEIAFSTAKAFAGAAFTFPDSNSHPLKAWRLYQGLTRAHLDNPDPSAVVMLTLDRLGYAKTHAPEDMRDSLYLTALEVLEQRYIGHEVSSFASAKIAEVHQGRGERYDGAESQDMKGENAIALGICKAAVARFPKSDGAILCNNIIVSIHHKSMELHLERINYPKKPFLALLSYKNIDKVWLRAVKIPAGTKASQDYEERKKWLPPLLKARPTESWTVDLPVDLDYNQHHVELKMPALENGRYVILVSSKADFSTDSNAVGWAVTDISRIGYEGRSLENGEGEFVVFDRETGEPLKGVKVKQHAHFWDYDTRKYLDQVVGEYETDRDGFFATTTPHKANGNNNFDFLLGEDQLLGEGEWSIYHQNPYEVQNIKRTTFFLDRGIYRPGQMVYYKGIVTETVGGEPKIVPNYATSVTLKDANYQVVATTDVKTNEFGSFAGTFTLPQGLLNGQMHLEEKGGSAYFSVEDYKRPKFEVEVDPVKGSFKLGEKVTVKGNAMAYAGSNVDGAEVKYRVVRTANFPWWGWCGWGRMMPNSPAAEIAQGKTMTDSEGKFSIDFEAVPDLSVSKSLLPQFNYQLAIDVVDVTGETHSTTANVSVGYLALVVDVSLAAEVDGDAFKGAKILSNNLNGQPEASKGTISVRPLKMPKQWTKPRRWGNPDKWLMSEAEFHAIFPNDLYAQEDDERNWERGKAIYSAAYDTEKSDSLKLPEIGDWPQGRYVMEIVSRDKFGAEVKNERTFTLYGSNETESPTNQLLWTHFPEHALEPGDSARVLTATGTSPQWVLVEVQWHRHIIARQWLNLAKGRKDFSRMIEEKYRGNLTVMFATARHGRFEHAQADIVVPWSNKELKIEYATFRDKLEPGSQEEWLVKIKGPGGEAAAAEMLAGMYDASLDAFRSTSWGLGNFPSYYNQLYWQRDNAFGTALTQLESRNWNLGGEYFDQDFDAIEWFRYPMNVDFRQGWPNGWDQGLYSFRDGAFDENMTSYYGYDHMNIVISPNGDGLNDGFGFEQLQTITGGTPAEYGDVTLGFLDVRGKLEAGNVSLPLQQAGRGGEGEMGAVKVRTNLNETAFFFPQLRTDAEGNIIFKFTMPEALTRWKFRTFAHTRDLKTGIKEATVVTQKELMVMPNPPRFFRENDEIVYSAKVSNLSEQDQTGEVVLELLDALTMQPIDVQLGNTNARQAFSVKKGQSTAISWTLKIPAGIQAVTHRVKAVAGNFSDGEENSLPVLTNSMLVTEAMPMPLRPLQTRSFEFARMTGNTSTTLRHHKLTLEFTSNPAWYAIQALPYMIEYPYECTEQTFSRYYANSIATHIANKYPRIKSVFDQWKTSGKEALLSNLEKNQELKYLLLEETPWVMDAQDEGERKKRVGLLFDLNRMADEMGRARKKLIDSQVSNGGFTWFPGMKDSRYITQHLVCGFGHLDKLGVSAVRQDADVWKMLRKAVDYLDDRMQEDYDWLVRHDVDLKKQHIGYTDVHYLYARSFFTDVKLAAKHQVAFDYYQGQAQEFWPSFNKYSQGMIALALHRALPDQRVPGDIVKSLKEYARHSDEMGMYWEEGSGLYWYQAPIETQALLIEVFSEVAEDALSVEEMKIWLLKQKQTQDWKTTKATAEACYALLLSGADYLAESKLAGITIGGRRLDPLNDPSLRVESGTGYFKTSWAGSEITPAMGKVEVVNNNKVVAWGALYWQYFEQLDKITFADNKVSIQKELYLEENTASGPKITPLSGARALKPGDKVKVRIILTTDRDMEYVHMKDMRASGFEPVNVISRYRWQDGLGYYESTRDAATNFFFDWLPKGRYVFEYPLRATHRGDFSNGVTTVQCMYAPEFTSHSAGVRVGIR